MCGLSKLLARVKLFLFDAGLKDSSLAIRKVNSSTVGHLSRVAKDAAVARSIAKFNEWYLSADGGSSPFYLEAGGEVLSCCKIPLMLMRYK